MQVYVCKMWLTCNSEEQGKLAIFDQYYPRSVAREWSLFAVDGAANLEDVLNNMLWSACQVEMASDVAGATASATFDSGWTVGGHGQHESDVNVKLSVGLLKKDWDFGAAPKAQMRAHVRWLKVTVVS